jgi:hypothetical protein
MAGVRRRQSVRVEAPGRHEALSHGVHRGRERIGQKPAGRRHRAVDAVRGRRGAGRGICRRGEAGPGARFVPGRGGDGTAIAGAQRAVDAVRRRRERQHRLLCRRQFLPADLVGAARPRSVRATTALCVAGRDTRAPDKRHRRIYVGGREVAPATTDHDDYQLRVEPDQRLLGVSPVQHRNLRRNKGKRRVLCVYLRPR